MRDALEHATQAPFGWAASGSTLFVWDDAEHTKWHAVYDLIDRSHHDRNLSQENADARMIVAALARSEAGAEGLDVERLTYACAIVEEEDERLGVLGRGSFIERLAAEYDRLTRAALAETEPEGGTGR